MANYQKIVDGLYQINGNVNVFLLDDSNNGITVIDAGMPRSVNSIVDTIKAIGRTVSDVKRIIITHADVDHIGSLAPLVELTHATVLAGEQSKHYIENRQAPPHLPIFLQPIMTLVNRLMLASMTVNQTVQDGELLPIAGGLRILELPGHTPDNICLFWEPERVLFAPDLLNMMRQDTLNLTFPIMTWNTTIAKDSARKALQLQPKFICVGHGRFIDVDKEPHQVENLLAGL